MRGRNPTSQSDSPSLNAVDLSEVTYSPMSSHVIALPTNIIKDPPTMKRLMFYHVCLAFIHCLFGVVISMYTAFSDRGQLPIMATFWDRYGVATSRVIIASVKVGYLSAVFLFLASSQHAVIVWVCSERYEKWIENKINPLRWIEYSFSASFMNVLIALLSGVLDIQVLISIYVLTALCMLLGLACELTADKELLSASLFWLGCLPWLAAWGLIFGAFFVAISDAEKTVPSFVYAIVFILFFLEALFAVNHYRKVDSFITKEIIYIVLSLVAKSSLAWITFGGVQAMS